MDGKADDEYVPSIKTNIALYFISLWLKVEADTLSHTRPRPLSQLAR